MSHRHREEFKKALMELELGLEERLDSKVGLLSGGQRQALTLLMATLVTPDLLLLDEHTAALDPKTALKVLELSQKIVEEHQITTLMITHNMEDALKYGNKTMIMKDGQIIAMIEGKEREEMTVEGLDSFVFYFFSRIYGSSFIKINKKHELRIYLEFMFFY